jgi:chromosome segregation protein
MRIKRLDITGFKSFMDRAVFTFDDGVTGIVGPNGCGKSNVVDSIRWVMGEQSAKNLRGRGMEDVIFNGSENKPPLSMAEVSLTFKIEEGDVLAPQFQGLPEVMVTRRLFRSGESEYLINKTVCRLLDITELFLGTGVGTRAYSIIEQGRVGMIVSAKPEDRRTFIEEAAGITKYKARRKAAERKMESTQANLLRVNDIVNELEKRLGTLERQAKKAEKFRKLRTEAREIELHQASHRWLELRAEAMVIESRLNNISGEERESLDRVSQMEVTIAEARAQLEADARSLNQLTESTHALESQVQLDSQNLEHWSGDLDATRRRVEQAQEELSALQSREAELRHAAASHEESHGALAGSSTEDEVALQRAQDELRKAVSAQTEISLRLESERKLLVEMASRLANHETNLQILGVRKAELESRRAKVAAEVELLKKDEGQLEGSRASVADQVGKTRQLASELAERKGQEEAQLVQLREAFAENEFQVIRAREDLADKRSRLGSLQEIQRNYDGFDRGVRAVMSRAGEEPRQQGVFGLVADVLSIPPAYEKALEAALGERLQHVIVESPEKGLELVGYLKSLSEGRSTFIPATLAATPRIPIDTSRPGVVTTAIAEVQAEESLRGLVEALLGDVVIFTDLDAARAYAAAGAEGLTLVTLEGEVLRPGGVITGGVLEGPAVGALQKKREIAELTGEVAILEERYNEIVTRHYTLQKQINHLDAVLKGLAKNQHAEELTLQAQEKDLHKAGEDLSKLRDRLTALEGEDRQLEQGWSALLAEEEASRGEVMHGQTDRETREDRVRQMALEAEGLKAKLEALQAELTSLRIKVASNAEKAEGAKKEAERITHQMAELTERLTRLRETEKEGSARLAELNERIAQTEADRAERAQKLAEGKAGLDERRVEHEALSARVRDDDAELKDLRTKVDSLTHGLSQMTVKERELSLELEHLQAQVAERHQTELKHELHHYHYRPRLTAEDELRLKDLRSQRARMGEINLTAIEEHQELSTRFNFLSGQKKDLEASLEQLQSAILKIDKTSRERFKQTFEVVNERFQQIFPRLFGGGRAGLVLTNEGPGQEPGIEIVAQPPGKKLQSVNLLSGGEKALTAVSMIFAIFLIRPTPFCLLDEVDAPLDEGNVGRYNDMVKEMSSQSQFILITHNKRTMEVVDTLYGVTMEEPGISKLVSVRMKEAVPANQDQVA